MLSQPTPLLQTKKLSMSFGGLQAISSLDMLVKEGEITGLIGPNGAGKTTLFNCVTGILLPTSGEILYRGVNLAG
ncbi:MAG: ATP-binding cassette domain-containing protein, partial [Candidatus Methylomirabilaceae bacterium]